MKILKLEISELRIPFKFTFKHASAERNQTQSLWIELHTDSGIVAHGESCPREYVTAETIHSARSFILEIKERLYQTDWDINTLEEWTEEHRHLINDNPAAWCAIEMALIDALAKTSEQSIEALIGTPEVSGDFYYSAIIGDAPTNLFEQWLGKYLSLNMSDFKIKLSGDPNKDREHIEKIHCATNGHCLIRVDANNMFNTAQRAIDYCKKFSDRIYAIEEPVKARRFDELQEIAAQLRVKIILDESFTTIEDFACLTDQDTPWIINLRVSKLGGILRSMEAIRLARQHQVPIIIGAHVGETSLLTRAAICVANVAKDVLLAQEGAFGTHFLDRDVTEHSIRFGMNGCISSKDLKNARFGLGVI